MTKEVLKTDETGIGRDLKKLEISAQQFQPLLNAMAKHGYEPTKEEFQSIVYGRRQKRDNPLDVFLRQKTVKKHPVIDSLPITQILKTSMIELPANCKEIFDVYNSLPAQSSLLADVYKMELKAGKVVVMESAKQAIIDSHTIYADEFELKAFNTAKEILERVKELQDVYNINFFQSNLVQYSKPGSLKGAVIKPEAVKFCVNQLQGAL